MPNQTIKINHGWFWKRRSFWKEEHLIDSRSFFNMLIQNRIFHVKNATAGLLSWIPCWCYKWVWLQVSGILNFIFYRLFLERDLVQMMFAVLNKVFSEHVVMIHNFLHLYFNFLLICWLCNLFWMSLDGAEQLLNL